MNKLFFSVALAAVCGFGTTAADEGKDESGKGNDRHYLDKNWKEKQYREGGKDWQTGTDGYYSEKEWKEKQHRDYRKDRRDDGHDSYFHEHGYTRLDIPPGHYPPPGECASGIPADLPGTSRLPASAIGCAPRCLRVPGSSGIRGIGPTTST